MLPNETEFKQTGTLPGEKVEMSIDEHSLAHIASILINLYSDKEMAVVREYSTNARDSHIEAGVNRPIEITTPSYLSYFFKVKDYGVGMSADDIRNIYSKYGASTGRITNDKAGMLGVGCKSGLTYTDQFTVVAIKDGIKVNVAVSRSVDGGGEMIILSETQTMDSNGVEIIIPVARNNSFAHKCEQFFQYWKQGEVLINGKPPVQPVLNKISDRVFLRENVSYYGKPVVVMGGISYEINKEQIKFPNSFVGFVNIGDVSFPPSREHLQYTPKTIATLESLKEEYKANLMVAVQADIDKQSTNIQAINCFVKWRNKLGREDVVISESDLNFKGKPLKSTFTFNHSWKNSHGFTDYPYEYNLLNMQGDVIVHGYEANKLTSYQRQKLNIWASDNNMLFPRFYFCKDIPGDGWLDDLEKVQWQDILDIKIPRAGSGKTNKVQYEMFYKGSIQTVEELDVNKPILYSTKGQWKKVTGEGVRGSGLFKDIQFVFIGDNRKDKFLRSYPSAQQLIVGLKSIVENFINNLTNEQKVFLRSNEYELTRFSNLDKTRLNDPQLVDIIERSEKREEIVKFQRLWDDLCTMSWDLDIKGMNSMFVQNNRTEWVEEKYPLLQYVINRSPYNATQTWISNYWSNIYIYLNAVHAINKGV